MKAVGVAKPGSPALLQELDVPIPAIDAESGILVRVRGAGVGFWDTYIRDGHGSAFGRDTLPYIPGAEFAGVVDRTAPSVTHVNQGDEVYAYFYGTSGAFAEFAAAKADEVALKPRSLSFVQAAALPVAAITAIMAIEESLRVQPGEKVFIAGVSGATGAIAAQLAKLAGAYVIGSAGAANASYARSLGVDEFIDYAEGDVATQVRAAHPEGVDVALDTVGGGSVETTARTLRSGGRFAGITGVEPQVDGITSTLIWSRPSRTRLERIAALVDTGKLRLDLGPTFPLAQAAEALSLVETRHARGKVVLDIGL